MESILIGLAVVACPLGMGLCMWLMARGMKRAGAEAHTDRTPSIEDLQSEQRRLQSEIDGLERAEQRVEDQLARR